MPRRAAPLPKNVPSPCGQPAPRAPPRCCNPRPPSPTSRSSTRPTASRRRDGQWLLQGDVLLKQGERTLKTRNASTTPRSRASASTRTSRSPIRISRSAAVSAQVDQTGGATFEGAQFELKDRNARGSADRIQVTRDQQLKLNGVRYTTCPVGEEDWVIRAGDIDIRQRAGLGFGRSVRLDFKGVPILYTPFISFPVGNQRKSGFLFPTIGTSTRSGSSLSVPWYWNIAPNYDATFVPTWFSKRGGKLDTSSAT